MPLISADRTLVAIIVLRAGEIWGEGPGVEKKISARALEQSSYLRSAYQLNLVVFLERGCS